MSATSRVGTAVAAGYLLGRAKKMRMALLVGSAMANRNVRAAGMDLIRGSTGDREPSPLLDAGRSAVIAAASTSMNRLSDRLHERRAALVGEDPDQDEDEGEPESEEDEEFDDEPVDDEELDDEPEDDEDDGSARTRRRKRAAAPGRS